jgi:glycosyltransferase involved in cell wall biosynthesis
MTCSKNKGIVMFLPMYEPLAMGGSEMQTKRLAKHLIGKGENIIIVTAGNSNLPRYELLEGIPVYRYIPIHQRIIGLIKKGKNRNIKLYPTQNEVIFDYSDVEGRDLLYPKVNVGIKQIIGIFNKLFPALLLCWKKRKEFDIIQINTVNVIAVIGTVIGKRLKKKIVVKDSTMDGINQMFKTPCPNVARRYLIRNVTVFVAMTRAIKTNYLKAGIPDHKIRLIPNGIDIINIPVQQKHFEYKFLFVGNLYQQPAKGVDILLKAWKNVIQQFPQATLTLIGDGNIGAYRQYMQKQGYAHSVVFVGKTDPKPYYLTHDIFVLPSRREGMSNALMEAMMYGLPVIATDVSGNQDLIGDGKGGYLVPANNVTLLCEKIIFLLQNPEQTILMGNYNRKNIERLCLMEKIADLYINCYNEINLKIQRWEKI